MELSFELTFGLDWFGMIPLNYANWQQQNVLVKFEKQSYQDEVTDGWWCY